MLGTYASAFLVLAAASAVGQALFALCGRRRWSWLSAPVGIAALLPLAWWSVRLPGEGTSALVAVVFVTLAALVYLRSRVDGLAAAAREAWPVLALSLLAASLPFFVEGRFGILGTGLNPDMSQHLFAADRLADSGSERLISTGYPLGPHALAVALGALGPSLVQAFGGITLATAMASALAALGALRDASPGRRVAGALLVAFAYMTAAYLTQGAFKETLQAMFVLAFAIGLAEVARGRLAGRGAAAAVPLAVLAAGSVYAYSFPGLLWLGGAAGLWALVELALAARRRGPAAARRLVRAVVRPVAVALAALAMLLAPELGRIVDFAGFETFDPDGEGLGNLFNAISPAEALGIWPSGDFRLDPGAGFAPAVAFWLGAALGLAALAFGLSWLLRRGERAAPAALAAGAALAVYANLAGTPYQEAKAIALAAPLAMLISVRALAEGAPTGAEIRRILGGRGVAGLFPRSARRARRRLEVAALGVAFAFAAAGSSLLALANGPVGPAAWSPALLELERVPGPTLVLGSEEFMEGEHGRDLLVWELRGGEVCADVVPEAPGGPPPPGIVQVVVAGEVREAPFAGAGDPRAAGPYTVWPIADPTPGESGCPFIADGARADPG